MRKITLYDALGRAMRTTGHKRYGFPRCSLCAKDVDSIHIEDQGSTWTEARVTCHGAEESFRFTYRKEPVEDLLHLMITDHVWFSMEHWEK